ncbi:WD40 repeat-like protein [Tilletiaria anomala UBC 951]|uniref:DDB1- and CUL4-associated factor 13 n=1 Tax=Tilletiaria anomala (strain ATCC 24038 / CBS 436.72 / UBC 951) TaxID=1037660 RepID=A0A066WDJ7_TILAU|nr:WD40 repeat-like protein [Tilletiaria anomala UBC 951]KDN52007.1 WD40 repeat-like protein [Tilletiaria anomala UBC 951]
MKITALSRSLDNHLPGRSGDATPVSRNLDPALHPFSKPREYTRALNAAKVDRMFAKPFVASLEGHVDGVYSLAKDPERLGVIASGSGDGEIKLWNLPSQSCLHTYTKAHKGIIQSLSMSPSSTSSQTFGRHLLSCSTDRTVKMWNADPHPDHTGWAGDAANSDDDEDDDEGADATAAGQAKRGGLLSYQVAEKKAIQPLALYAGKAAFNSVSHHYGKQQFASASSVIQIWDLNRSGSSGTGQEALNTITWGSETINVVKFNASERDVLASAGSDRSVVLYDLRAAKPLTKLFMTMRANDISWSPIEPTVFALASEDHNVYTFDMRNMASATQIYKDHVAAVMSVDWAPTGQELVSASYDRTLRLWEYGRGAHSRDVYHTKRMQRIFSAAYSLDARYVLSGSDDGNVRIWKARASEKIGILSGREMAAKEYRESLQKKWSHTGDVKRVSSSRNVPKPIKAAQQLKRTMLEAERVKEERRRKHTKTGNAKPKAARKAAVLAQKE